MSGLSLLVFFLFFRAFPSLSGPGRVPAAEVELVFRDAYPLEGSVSFSAALFHWVDSLAGTSGGKTISAYQEEFKRRFGAFTEKDISFLREFQAARLRESSLGRRQDPSRGSLNMLGVFLQEPDPEAALARIEPVLGPEVVDGMASALEHFRPRYEEIWNGGSMARRFLDGARTDPARKDVEGFLARVAHFFGVDPLSVPRPRLVVVPVPPDNGTHAQAVGKNLLVEIRPGEGVIDQVAPIVHENAHYLWQKMGQDLRDRLVEVARNHAAGAQAWGLLREALPTAIAQGAAERTFHPARWSSEVDWYHTAEVDSYAKRIYPVVQEALDTGAPFDEIVMRKLLWAFQGGRGRDGRPKINPR